jgi:hypothetical protein
MIMQLNTPDIQDRPADTGRSGKWWSATLVSLMVLAAVCLLILVMAHDRLTAVVWIGLCSLAGAPMCIVFATISFVKREKHSLWTSIIALPCLALLAWELFAVAKGQFQRQQSANNFELYSAYLDQLKADPEIGLREHWATTLNAAQSEAFHEAVSERYVQFSASQVEHIYAEEMPMYREEVFRQAACTPEFISAHFQEAFDLARKNSVNMLENIDDNPHTPLQLVQRVVFFRKQLPVDPSYQAGLILQIRKSNVPADPRGILQPYVHEAERKFFILTLRGNNFRTLDGGGSRRFPDREVNSYMPGVPLDFDLMQLSPDDLVFLPGLYSEDTDVDMQQLHLAEAFALEHNQQVFRQRAAKRSSP